MIWGFGGAKFSQPDNELYTKTFPNAIGTMWAEEVIVMDYAQLEKRQGRSWLSRIYAHPVIQCRFRHEYCEPNYRAVQHSYQTATKAGLWYIRDIAKRRDLSKDIFAI